MPSIKYLSPPERVSMGDQWFAVSPLGHFWVQRRFEVFQKLAGNVLQNSRNIAEIGCGHGLIQRQIEEAYGREVTGFDLNEFALQRNQSHRSPVFCYDISQRSPQFRHHFDFIVMFDVLEHIEDEGQFLQSALFHLSKDGKLAINVPAGQWIYSAYDRAAGHKRRYSIRTLRDAAKRNNLELVRWTYWGFPLLPLAVLRKLWLLQSKDDSRTISAGFDPRSDSMNYILAALARCELIPQKRLGASLMAIFRPSTHFA